MDEIISQLNICSLHYDKRSLKFHMIAIILHNFNYYRFGQRLTNKDVWTTKIIIPVVDVSIINVKRTMNEGMEFFPALSTPRLSTVQRPRCAQFHPIRSSSLYWFHADIKPVLNPTMKLIRGLEKARSAESMSI